jgi:hypothetical protein
MFAKSFQIFTDNRKLTLRRTLGALRHSVNLASRLLDLRHSHTVCGLHHFNIHRSLILWCFTAGFDFLTLGTEARVGIGFRSAAHENIAGVAGCFLLIILPLGDDHQHAWGDRLPRPVREIYEAFPLETIKGLIRRMSVHGALVARYAIVNPDMKVVRIEKQPVMLAGSGTFHSRVLGNIDSLSWHNYLQYFYFDAVYFFGS